MKRFYGPIDSGTSLFHEILVIVLIINVMLVGLGIVTFIRLNNLRATLEPRYLVIETPGEGPRYGFTDDEIFLMAQLLCGDKRIDGDGEYDFDFKKVISQEEVNKVMCVVMNRVRSNRYPNNVKDVVLQPNHFSVMPRNLQAKPSDIALYVVRMWCEAYDSYDISIQTIPETHLYFSGDGKTNTTRGSYVK